MRGNKHNVLLGFIREVIRSMLVIHFLQGLRRFSFSNLNIQINDFSVEIFKVLTRLLEKICVSKVC